MEGRDAAVPIDSMPGQARLTIDRLVAESRAAHGLGVPAVALFPAVEDDLKDRTASGALDPDGLVQRAVRELKSALPEMLVITDVAMDPYSSDGHDGLVEDGEILNDPTLEILAATAVSQADAGADVIAPSDMMDGRVGAIRTALDSRRPRPGRDPELHLEVRLELLRAVSATPWTRRRGPATRRRTRWTRRTSAKRCVKPGSTSRKGPT